MNDQATADAASSTPVSRDGNDGFAVLRSQLPAELASHPALQSYTSLEGLARSHVAAQRMIGKRIEDATPEELGRYYARHGRPAKPEDYKFSGNAPPDAEPNELERAARIWFHEAGMSQRQAEVLHEHWSKFATASSRNMEITRQEQRSAAENELRSEWGRTYDRKVATAVRAVSRFGGEDLMEYLEETGLGNDPRLVRAFARIAETIGEDALIGEGERGFTLDPEGAREEIARALREPAYFDADHPEHGASVDRMRALFAAAYPEIPR